MLGLGCPKQAFAKIATPRAGFATMIDILQVKYLGSGLNLLFHLNN
ncbi:hypothetical protein [Bathymodiolus platifrons methanotrophic gill symbiont]|nr:hypothetical protein [Bathymodiolus platifrons methanotrophic gill symbiont]